MMLSNTTSPVETSTDLLRKIEDLSKTISMGYYDESCLEELNFLLWSYFLNKQFEGESVE